MASTDNSETVVPIVPVEPETPVIAPVEPSPSLHTVYALCEALRDFEGKPGDRNYKNNNPGNCRYNADGYLAIYGHVGKDKDGFAIFKDYATGWLYLNNMVKGMIHKHPNWSVFDFISRYAPASDGNPVEAYAAFLIKRLGVDNTFKIGSLV